MARTETRVAEALGRAHTALLEDLRKMDEAVHPTAGEGLAELRARLDATRRHITEHFRFEEQNGYMDAVRKREPRFERSIDQLAEEHRRLAQSLDALIGEAKAATSPTDVLREQAREWVGRVRQHEVRENDLVQNAFNLDMGPED